MEIADCVIVNKYDSEFVKSWRIAKFQIQSALHLSRPKVDGWVVPVELVSAHSNINIDSIWDNAMKFKECQKDYIVDKRGKQLLHGLWAYLGDMLLKKLKEDSDHKYANIIQKAESRLVNQEITPNYAASEILRNIFGE